MRLAKTLTVIALVGLLPAISWFYLSKGADWRRAGLAEISERVPLDVPDLRSATGETVGQQALFGKFAIAVDADANLSGETMGKITEQFGVRRDMQFLAFSTGTKALPEPWVNFSCTSDDCVDLKALLFADAANGVLIDDSLQLRRRYDLSQQEELNKLIEHGAILLPTEKREKIDLIRGQ